MPYMYILKCSDGSYYVGSTWNLERRMEQHASGRGAAYTRRRQPVELVYAEEFELIYDAYSAEKKVQGWGRAKREALISGNLAALPALSRKKRGDSSRPQ